MMGILNPSQKQQVNQMQGTSKQEQAEKIAQMSNELGLSKEQLEQIIRYLGG